MRKKGPLIILMLAGGLALASFSSISSANAICYVNWYIASITLSDAVITKAECKTLYLNWITNALSGTETLISSQDIDPVCYNIFDKFPCGAHWIRDYNIIGGAFHGYWQGIDSQYSIKLSTDDNLSSGGVLAEVEPGKVTKTLRAKVYNNNQPVPNVNVKLEVTVEANSGGHQHNVNRPKGIVNPAEGNTGADGSGHAFTFTAPAPAGDHKIKATCIGQECTQEGPDKIWVGVKGLIPIPPIPDLLPQATYQLNESNGQPIGRTDIHPENHYLTPDAVIKLWNLGFRYSAIEFPNYPLLHVNDASLVRGGLFDLDANWRPKHHEHRRGTVVDVRANGGPGSIPVDSAVHRTFEIIARRLGADAEIHGDGANQHYHVRLRGIRE